MIRISCEQHEEFREALMRAGVKNGSLALVTMSAGLLPDRDGMPLMAFCPSVAIVRKVLFYNSYRSYRDRIRGRVSLRKSWFAPALLEKTGFLVCDAVVRTGDINRLFVQIRPWTMRLAAVHTTDEQELFALLRQSYGRAYARRSIDTATLIRPRVNREAIHKIASHVRRPLAIAS